MYKLVDPALMSHNNYQWTIGEWRMETDGTNIGAGSLHCYNDALVGYFVNPVTGHIKDARLFKCECLDSINHGYKITCRGLKLTEELLPPRIDQEHRIRIALMVSLEVCGNPQWRAWADSILNGTFLKFISNINHVESEQERLVRSLAYKAATYENVEHNSALCITEASKIKILDYTNLATLAYGRTFTEVPAKGRTRYGGSLR